MSPQAERPPRVLHVVNALVPESIPLEVAARLPSAGIETAVASYYEAPPDAPVPEAGVAWFPLGAGSLFSRRAATRLRRALETFDPDVVHVHHPPSAQVAAAIVGVGRDRCLVKTEHNDHRRQSVRRNLAALVVLGRCTRVVGNSRSTLDSFYPWERLVTRGRLVTILNGVDVDRVRAATPVRLPLGGFVIASVGRLVPQKNHLRLVEALAVARASAPDLGLGLVIVGGGRLEGRLRRRIAELDLSSAVHITGSVSRDTVYGILRSARACIVPSLWEGFCNAAVEAMAAGLPMAVSDLPVLGEVLGDVGLRFDPTDVGAIAAALSALPAHGDGPVRANGRRRADELSLDTCVGRHAEMYRELAAART